MNSERNKTLILLFGDLPRESFLTQQLRLKSVFNLFADDQWFCANPETWFPLDDSLRAKVEFRRADGILSANRIAEFSPNLVHFGRVILWPIWMHPLDRRQWEKCLTLALTGKCDAVKLGSATAIIISATLLGGQLPELHCEDFAAAPGPFNPLRVSPRARAFNQMHNHGEIITKISQSTAKSEAEIFFLRNVPPVLQNYYPGLLSSDHGPGISSYQILRFNMMDLSRHLIHRSLAERDWEIVFERLNDYLALCPRRKVSTIDFANATRQLFTDKLESRMAQIPSLSKSSELDKMAKTISAAISASTETNELVFSHGDLCFSNILFDLQTQEIKLVDPRGSSAEEGTFLPQLYDFAKLSQCIFGGYDLIVAGNLEVPQLASDFEMLKRLFRKLMKTRRIDERSVRMAEASLFLSMISLHLDQPKLHPAMVEAARRAMITAEAHSRAS